MRFELLRKFALIERNCGRASLHEVARMGLADAHSADGASMRAKSTAPAIDQRAFMLESLEYSQLSIKSATKSFEQPLAWGNFWEMRGVGGVTARIAQP